MTERDKQQIRIVEHYMREGPDRTTLELSTGFGKSKIAIDILKHLQPDKVLLLVNSTVLRDDSWKKEFEKFGLKDYYENNVETATYQLVYKWKAEVKDLDDYFIIADEVDFASDVPELSKFFYEYPNNKILGLTGFITSTKKPWFEKHLPILATLTATEAQEKGILNNIHFIFVKYDLSKNPKDLLVEYTKHGEKKSFTQSENAAYDYAHAQYAKWVAVQEINNKNFMEQQISYEEYLKTLNTCEYKIKRAVQSRADVLLYSKSSVEITKKLIAYTQRHTPKAKTIVFSKRTSQSLAICGEDNVYNGSVPKTKADKNYKDFQTGDSLLLGVCDKVNRGVNIDNLQVAVLESFYGSDTQAVQRFGRMLRLDPNQMATVYILLPYFLRTSKTKDKLTQKEKLEYVPSETQQIVWAAKMLRSTDVKSKAVWDYRTVKT